MTEIRLRTRRYFVQAALFSHFILAGCGNSQSDDTHVQIGEKTKAENKARAEMYKKRELAKKKGARNARSLRIRLSYLPQGSSALSTFDCSEIDPASNPGVDHTFPLFLSFSYFRRDFSPCESVVDSH